LLPSANPTPRRRQPAAGGPPRSLQTTAGDGKPAITPTLRNTSEFPPARHLGRAKLPLSPPPFHLRLNTHDSSQRQANLKGSAGTSPSQNIHIPQINHAPCIHSCPFVVQNRTLIRTSFVVQKHPSFVSIRVHSWFKTAPSFAPIRGSTPPLIRVHSCPFVVQNTTLIRTSFVVQKHPSFVLIRVHSWFKTPPHSHLIRGSKHHPHSCPFVVQPPPPHSLPPKKHHTQNCPNAQLFIAAHLRSLPFRATVTANTHKCQLVLREYPNPAARHFPNPSLSPCTRQRALSLPAPPYVILPSRFVDALHPGTTLRSRSTR